MDLLNKKTYCLLAALVAALALLGAYAGQYFWGWMPCQLCLYQRYVFMVIVGAGGVLAFWPRPTFGQSLGILGLLYMGNAGIALYQVLVEKKILALPEVCRGSLPKASSFEAFKAGFENLQAMPPCDQVPVVLFGISMAGYNLLMCLMVGLGLWFLAGLGLCKKSIYDHDIRSQS